MTVCRHGLAVWAAIAWLTGCELEPSPELLDVGEVGPARIDGDGRLQVRGSGFPTGRIAQLRVEGRLHRPGERPRQLRIDLEGRALSSELLEARLTGAMLEDAGRGTLRGHVTVAFEAAGDGVVVGRSPRVTLDLTPPSSDRLGAALDLRRRANELSRALGLALGEEDPSAPGLPIEQVEEGSVAAEVGLASGDRVVALEGLRLLALADLVPPPGLDLARFEVARPGEVATFEVVLPLPRRDGGISSLTLRLGQLALAWALLIGLMLAPTATLTDWVVQGSNAPRARARYAHWLVGGAFFASLVALARFERLHVPLEVVLVSTLAARAAAAHLGASPGTRAWTRLAGMAGALGASVLATVAVCALGAAGGTTDLVALHDQQGPWPWEWAAFRSPAGPLVVALVIAAGAYGPRLGGLSGRLAGAVEQTVALVLAAVLSATLLGGWSAPAHSGSVGAILGPAAFVLKGLLCWGAMRRAAPARSRGLGRATLAVLAAGAAAAWIAWEPSRAVEDALAEVLSAVAGALAVWLLYRRVGEVHEPLAAPPHPFL